MIDDNMTGLPVQNEIIVELKAVKSMDHIYNSAMFELPEGNWLQGLCTSEFWHVEGANQTPDILGFEASLSVFICASYRRR
jgi:hypothetical protein